MSVNTRTARHVIKPACVLLFIFAAAAVIQNLPIAHAALPPLIRVDSVNGQDPSTIVCPTSPLTSPVTIVGSGQGSTPPGRVEQYGVMINWGDGSPVEIAPSVFTPPRGRQVDFTFTYTTNPHVYANGTYTITISLFHSQGSGNDNQIDSTVQLQVCTFTPNPPAIEVDLLNGQDPSSFTCPDNPVSGPVTLEGDGQGSAPPGTIEDYGVVINWGDGTPAEEAVATFSPSSGTGNFTYTYESLDHTYAVGGSYSATISLVRSTSSGDVVVASRTLSICSFTAVEPSIEIDLINGEDPTTIVCPDSPASSPVTIEGGGQGSAPPGIVEDYSVVVDWGDGSTPETANATFDPATGNLVNFTYSFETPAHEYAQSGTYTVSLSLVRADASGENETVVSTSAEICVLRPVGTVTGEVFDSLTGFALFGAIVEDITDEEPILGSFPGGSVYVVQSPPGLRTIRVSAPGWQDGVAQVAVTIDEVSTLDFVLDQNPTNQNVVGVQLPLGGNGDKVFVVPECVEAVANNQVVATSCVHAGSLFFFVGLPNGQFTFRSANSFYNVGQTTTNLTDGVGTRDNRGWKLVKLPASVPEALTRVPVITGNISGTTRNQQGTGVATSVFATFSFEGNPVTVTTDTGSNGVYALTLIPPGSTQVYANSTATSARSPNSAVSVVGGTTVTQNLTVFPFDAETANFVPVITDPDALGTNEDVNLVLGINNFTVTDANDTFSTEHTLEVYPGFNYTVSNKTASGAQVNPNPNFNGVLVVPVTVSDSINASSPFDITVNVTEVPDPTVYVNFDTGLTGPSARGTQASPFKTVGAALAVVSPGGTILIGGLATSTEPLFTINQSVILQNNNPGGEVVRINPSAAQGVAPADTSTNKTGFVSGSVSPK